MSSWNFGREATYYEQGLHDFLQSIRQNLGLHIELRNDRLLPVPCLLIALH